MCSFILQTQYQSIYEDRSYSDALSVEIVAVVVRGTRVETTLTGVTASLHTVRGQNKRARSGRGVFADTVPY